MGMTIEEAIEWYNGLECYTPQAKEARVVAIETMRKYRKILGILNSTSYIENGIKYSYTYDEDTRVKHIIEVVEDGNDNL